jgi:chitinase
MGFSQIGTPTASNTGRFATEHILEFQMVKNFFEKFAKPTKSSPLTKINCYNTRTNINFCKCIQSFRYDVRVAERVTINGVTKSTIDWVGAVFPNHTNQWSNELVLLDGEVNNIKEDFWGVSDARNADTLDTYTGDSVKLFKYVKDTIAVIRYHIDLFIRQTLVAQKDRVSQMLNDLETIYLPQITKNINNQQVTWQSLDLQTKWNTYMRTQNAAVITKSFTLVDKYLAKLVDRYTSVAQREAAERGTPDALILKGLIEKIDALQADWTNNEPVRTNPL